MRHSSDRDRRESHSSITGIPPQKTESTLITASLTEEGILTMSAWNHEVGTEKNAEKEMWIRKSQK